MNLDVDASFSVVCTETLLDSSTGKNPPVMQETWVPSLGREGPLAKGWAAHSSVLGLPWWLIW